MIGSIVLEGPVQYSRIPAGDHDYWRRACCMAKKGAGGPRASAAFCLCCCRSPWTASREACRSASRRCRRSGVCAPPYDFMFWTNAFMLVVALGFGIAGNEIMPGISFCTDNPAILRNCQLCLLSAVRASSSSSQLRAARMLDGDDDAEDLRVLLSIFVNKHSMNAGWAGIGSRASVFSATPTNSKQKKH